MLLTQLTVYLPSAFDNAKNSHRALPFFEYLITSMERNGLDKEKNAEDLAIVDKYISVDAIHELNERQGDYNYNDNIIIYSGLVPGATDQDKVNFQNAVIRLIIHNPLVYIRSQIGRGCTSPMPSSMSARWTMPLIYSRTSMFRRRG